MRNLQMAAALAAVMGAMPRIEGPSVGGQGYPMSEAQRQQRDEERARRAPNAYEKAKAKRARRAAKRKALAERSEAK